MDCSLSWLAILQIYTTTTLLVSPSYRLCHAMKSIMVTCVYPVLQLLSKEICAMSQFNASSYLCGNIWCLGMKLIFSPHCLYVIEDCCHSTLYVYLSLQFNNVACYLYFTQSLNSKCLHEITKIMLSFFKNPIL